MKSILWILNGCGLEGQNITGSPIRFYEMSKRMLKKFNNHIMTTIGGKTMQTTLGCKIPMTVVKSSLFLKREPFKLFRFWSYLVTVFSWKSKLKELLKVDLIITTSDYFCDIVPAMSLKKKWNCKWIAQIHHCELPVMQRSTFKTKFIGLFTKYMQSWSFKKMAKYADSIWVYDSPDGTEAIRRLSKYNDNIQQKIRRMKNGIDFIGITDAFEPVEKSTDAIMIGIRPNKGMYDIVPVWKEVEKLRPGTSLTLIGCLDEVSNIEQEIKDNKLNITIFRPKSGFLKGKEYYKKIKESKILFAPTHTEPWGIAYCEGMAAGLAVVSYDLDTYQTIYTNSYCPVKCFDFKDFAQKIVEVLNDKQLMTELGQKAHACAEQYDWNNIIEDDMTFIQNFI